MTAVISIVTPCYNAEKTIAQTIESVLAQSFSDWEMLVVDDCSSDSSAEIIRNYAQKDPRIRYYKTPSPSGSPALPRNIGIDNAKGEFIAFLDADDIWLPEKLKKEYDFARENGYSLVYSYYEKMDWQGKKNGRIVKTRPLSTYNTLLQSNAIPCLTSMVSKTAIGDTRFRHIPQEDFCFWLDILKKGYTAHNLCEVTAFYRDAQNSRSANKWDMFKGYWNVLNREQNIPTLKCCFYMLTYTLHGFAKYFK